MITKYSRLFKCQMDLKKADGEVTGIFAKSGSHLLYPCIFCAAEVTDKQDSSGFGLHAMVVMHTFIASAMKILCHHNYMND